MSGAALTEGNHSITATVVDSAGATNSASVQITVSRYAPAKFRSLSQGADGTLQFFVSGDVAGQHILEVSTNLSNWFPVTTNTTSNGLLDWLQNHNPARSSEFFRVRTQH